MDMTKIYVGMRTAQDVYDSMNKEQKATLYYLVGWAVNNNNIPFLVLNYKQGDESESHKHRKWPVFRTFNDDQKKLTSMIIDNALKGKEIEDGIKRWITN